jgi:hypothetical protein
VNRLLVILFLVSIFGNNLLFSQDKKVDNLVFKDSIQSKKSLINPLAPAKAAFYSALLITKNIGKFHLYTQQLVQQLAFIFGMTIVII